MWSIETLILYGNPVCNQHPKLAQIEGDFEQLKDALEEYFGQGGSTQGLNQVPAANLGGSLGQSSKPAFGQQMKPGLAKTLPGAAKPFGAVKKQEPPTQQFSGMSLGQQAKKMPSVPDS